MNNTNADIEKESNNIASQETTNINSQQMTQDETNKIDNEQKQPTDKIEAKDEKTVNTEVDTKIDVKVDVENNENSNNVIQINIDKHSDNDNNHENIGNDAAEEKEMKVELNVNILDKLFSSTQQQKSVHKEENDENIDDKKDEAQIENSSIKSPETETNLSQQIPNADLTNNNENNSNEQPKNANEKESNDNNENISSSQNNSNLTEMQPVQNDANNLQPTTTIEQTQIGNQDNPEIPTNDIDTTANANNENSNINSNIENTNIANQIDNNSYSSSYYEYDEDTNYNNANPLNNLIGPKSTITNNNNINADKNNNNNTDITGPNKVNFSALDPIYARQKEMDDGVPPALKPLIFHAKDSLTYQALCGKPIYGLKQSALTSIVNDLRKYVDMAVDHNLINEACHIQMCIDTIRNDHSAEKMQADKEMVEIDKKLQEANLELEERMNFWKSQEYSAQKEFEMQMTDLMINKDQALSDLDNEWQSPKKQQLYSKPSPALLNMRHMAKKMIRTQQFEEVKKLARLIEVKEKQEIDEATKRMEDDYHFADQRLNEHYDHEQRIIESMHEMKLHNIARSRDQNLRPLYQRIENLQKLKDQASKVQKKAEKLVMASTPRKRGPNSNNVSSSATPRYLSSKSSSRVARVAPNSNKSSNAQKQLPQLLVTPKLALPPVRRIQREGAKSQIAQTSMMQNQQQQQQQTQQPSLYRPKALSRLSNSAAEKNSNSRKTTASPKYH